MDLQAASAFTGGSAEHERFFGFVTKPGLLTVRGQMNLFEMLQPAIQPGAALDYERPLEEVTVSLEASGPFTALFGSQSSSCAHCADHALGAVAGPARGAGTPSASGAAAG